MTQAQALAIMKTGVSIYLTGSAGSGKTYLLNQYIQYLKEHDIPVAITASTGIAATHMNGMTIHGWSGIGIREFLTEKDMEDLEERQYLWKRFEKARVLIIDEVSMLHAHRLDMVERICRRFKRNDAPFGGLQVILSGDFFQLPPISKQTESSSKDMVYTSEAWRIMNPAICYLTEQHRQEDDTLTEILNTIRTNTLEEYHYEQLEKRLHADISHTGKPTKLYTHNVNVDDENTRELDILTTDEESYRMISTGKENLVEILKKSCLAHQIVHLKIGAEVMCIKNNFEEGYVNGTRGIIIGFRPTDRLPIVELSNGKILTFTPDTWAIEEDGKVKASISQIPLRLAWALTIHKSQGMSLDHAEIDLSRTFTYGMGYVALSRVRTLDGIRLIGFSPDALRVDPSVLAFDITLQKESADNEILFSKLSSEEQRKLEHDFIIRMGGTIIAQKIKKEPLQKVSTYEVTKTHLHEKRTVGEIATIRNLTQATILSHIEHLNEKDMFLDISYLKPPEKHITHVTTAYKKLSKEDREKLTPLKQQLEKNGHTLSFEEIRLARIFIDK